MAGVLGRVGFIRGGYAGSGPGPGTGGAVALSGGFQGALSGGATVQGEAQSTGVLVIVLALIVLFAARGKIV